MKNKLKIFISFGHMELKKIISYLFIFGSVIPIYKSILFANFVYLNNFYQKEYSYLNGGQAWYGHMDVNNLPLAIFAGIVYFIVAIILWKLICELIFIIFERIKR